MPAEDSPAPRPIVLDQRIPAPRRDVWAALTTNAGLRSFLSPKVRVELRRGGPFEICFDLNAEPGLQGSEGCRVLSYLDERMLSFTWNAPPQFDAVRWQRTFVVVELEEDGTGATLVRLTHDGWQGGEQWDEARTYFEPAWGRVLQALRERIVAGDAQEELPEEPPEELAHFVYYIHPARAGFFGDRTEFEETKAAEHAEYVRSLLARGRLILAGPSLLPTLTPNPPEAVSLDIPPPGIVVFKARDAAEAQAVLDADPAVAAGVFKGQVNTFRVAFLEDIAP